MSIPKFIRLYEKFERQGFEIIGIKLDDASESSQEMVQGPLVPWTSLYDNPENGIANEFKLRISQSIFLVDRDGTIVSSHRHLNSADLSVDLWTGESQRVHATEWTINSLFNNDQQ